MNRFSCFRVPCLLVLIACGVVRAERFEPARPVLTKQAVTTQPRTTSQAVYRLARVVQMVEDSNAVNLVGHDRWHRLLDTYRGEIERSTSHASFAESLNKLLKASGVSHFKYYTDEDWSFWHVKAYFHRSQGDFEVSHVGLYTKRIDGLWFVRGILEGSPADQTAIRVGDEILSVDGRPFEPIRSFTGMEGEPVNLRMRRRLGMKYNATLTPVSESLYKAMQSAMRRSVRIEERDGLRVAYLHGWTTLGDGREYQTLLKLQDDADGLILDYRDGFGGTWQAAQRFLLGGKRRSRSSGQLRQWVKPVVILTGDGTRSAKEIVVNAVQEAGRGVLIGQPTPGHVTSVGGVRSIGDDGLLMLPGSRFSLEGTPTLPDIAMARDIRFCAGADPQLAFAHKVLAKLIRQADQAR